jgi:K+-transporting ATPase KdpF subunit
MAGAAEMSLMNWIGLVLAIVLGIYLFVALLLPEKFE